MSSERQDQNRSLAIETALQTNVEVSAITSGNKKIVLIPSNTILENAGADEFGWHPLQAEESIYRSALTAEHINWLQLRLPGIENVVDLQAFEGNYYMLHSNKASMPLRHLDGHIDKNPTLLPTIEPGGDIPSNQIEHTEEQKQQMKDEAVQVIQGQEEQFPLLDTVTTEDGQIKSIRLVAGDTMSNLQQIGRYSLLKPDSIVSPFTKDVVAVSFGPEGAEFVGYKYGKISEVAPIPTTDGESRSKLETLVRAIGQTIGYDERVFRNITKGVSLLAEKSKEKDFKFAEELAELRQDQRNMTVLKDEFQSIVQYLHNELISSGRLLSKHESAKPAVEGAKIPTHNQPITEQVARNLYTNTQLGAIIDSEWRQTAVQSKYDSYASSLHDGAGNVTDESPLNTYEFKQLTKKQLDETQIAQVLTLAGTSFPTIAQWKDALIIATQNEVDQELTNKVKDFLAIIGQAHVIEQLSLDSSEIDIAPFATLQLSKSQPEKADEPEAISSAIYWAQTAESVWNSLYTDVDITEYEIANQANKQSFAELPEPLKKLSYFLETQTATMGLASNLNANWVLNEYRNRQVDTPQLDVNQIVRLISNTAVSELVHWQNISEGLKQLNNSNIPPENFANYKEIHSKSIIDFTSGLVESVFDLQEIKRDFADTSIPTRELFKRLESLGLDPNNVNAVFDLVTNDESLSAHEVQWLKQFANIVLPVGHRGNYASAAELVSAGLALLRSGKPEVPLVLQMAAGGHPTPSMLFPSYSSTMLHGYKEINSLNTLAQQAGLPQIKPELVVLNAYKAAQAVNHAHSPELYQAVQDTRKINQDMMDAYLQLDFVEAGNTTYTFKEDLSWKQDGQANTFQEAILPYANRVFNLDVTLALNQSQQEKITQTFGEGALTAIQQELKSALSNNKSQKTFKQAIAQLGSSKAKVSIKPEFWQEHTDLYAELEHMYTAAEGLYAVARMGLSRRNPQNKEEVMASIQDSMRYAIMHLFYFADVKGTNEQEVPMQVNYISEDEEHFRKVRKYVANLIHGNGQYELRSNTFDTGVSEGAQRKSYYPDSSLPLFSDWDTPEAQQELITYLCADKQQMYQETEKQAEARFVDTNALLCMPSLEQYVQNGGHETHWYEEKAKRAKQYVAMLLQIQAANPDILDRMKQHKDLINQYQERI